MEKSFIFGFWFSAPCPAATAALMPKIMTSISRIANRIGERHGNLPAWPLVEETNTMGD
jgi:hypothetical protein